MTSQQDIQATRPLVTRNYSPAQIKELFECIPWMVRDWEYRVVPLTMTPSEQSHRLSYLKVDVETLLYEFLSISDVSDTPKAKQAYIASKRGPNMAFMEEAVLIDGLIWNQISL